MFSVKICLAFGMFVRKELTFGDTTDLIVDGGATTMNPVAIPI